MSPYTILLVALGGIVQIGGVGYAVIGFEDINMLVLVGAIFIGGVIESAGILVHALSSKKERTE